MPRGGNSDGAKNVGVKLTKRIIEQAQPKEKRFVIWDTEVRGLGLRITPPSTATGDDPRPRKAFILNYRTADTTQRRMTLGLFGSDLTLEQARKLAQARLSEVAAGADPLTTKKEGREAPTVSRLCDRYLEEHARPHKKPSSLRNDELIINNYVKPKLGGKKLVALDFDEVAGLHNAMRETPYLANRTVALLSKMLNLAEQWKLRPLHSNPCRHIKRHPEKKRTRKLSEIEIARLAKILEAAESGGLELQINSHVIAALRFVMFTGCRIGEALSLKWSEVDLEAGCLWLEDSKTGAKDIALNSAAREILKAQPRLEGTVHVFPGRKKGQPLTDIKKPWAKLRDRASLGNMRLHDFRRTFAATAAAGGLSLYQIGQLLGHKSQQTTARYSDLLQDPKRHASEQVAQALMRAINSETQ